MAATTQKAADLKKLLNNARSGPINFGVCMGKTAETTILLLDRSKTPRSLGSSAKAMGETTKSFFGDVEVDGSRARFSCESDPPSGSIGILKKFFAAHKLGFTPEFATDISQDLNDGADSKKMLDRSDMSPDMKKWEKIDNAIEAKVRMLMKAKQKPPAKGMAAWKQIRKHASRGQVKMALRSGPKVLKMMEPPKDKADKSKKKGAMMDMVRQMASRLKGKMTPAQEKYLKAAANQAKRGADEKAAALLRAVQKAA
ncbi:MAG: hypothetical protein AAF393_11435 [Pseudomonadota bacterium]